MTCGMHCVCPLVVPLGRLGCSCFPAGCCDGVVCILEWLWLGEQSGGSFSCLPFYVNDQTLTDAVSAVNRMDGYFVYRRSTLKGYIASNKMNII